MNRRLRLFALFFLPFTALQAQPGLYFPPKTGIAWETLAPDSLGFCPQRIDSLYAYLDDRGTKGFLLLQDGRIVLEKYFDTFTRDSIWYWASAGKTLTAFLVGQAQEKGLLDIGEPTSTYLGQGWTTCPPDKETLITVRHQLSMTSGLQDNVPNDNCKADSCLRYLADAGTRWAYHNAPYLLLQDVIEAASGQSYNQFTTAQVKSRTGMIGFWFDGVYYSRPRDMARFGLLMQAGGVWDGDTLLADQKYLFDATHPSQQINNSYGYLWWLNGQPSFMLPDVQFVFPGKIVPNAPDDMIAALGKNDQKIHIVPSRGWVIVRMGEAGYTGPGGGNVPVIFDNVMWDYLNRLDCNIVNAHQPEPSPSRIQAWPNPTRDAWVIESEYPIETAGLFAFDGRLCRSITAAGTYQLQIDAAGLPPGVYALIVQTKTGVEKMRLLKW